MVFRDERDALRARAESAEEQLAQARHEIERMRAAAEQRSPSSAPSGPGPSSAQGARRWVRRAAILAGVGTGIGGLLFYLTASLDHTAEATWRAVVRDGGGFVAPGAACTLTGRFRSNGETRVAARVDVRCGDVVLYAGDREFGGLFVFGPRRCGVWEGAAEGGQPGVYHYRIDCSDPGALELDTAHGRLLAVDASGHRVEMSVEQYSEPRRGKPLYDGNSPAQGATFAAFERTGKVRTTTRADQVREGATCVLRVEPAFSRRHNCRLAVRCDDHTLYGVEGTGFMQCEMDKGQPVRANDARGTASEGDPILKMDLLAGSVAVSDDVPGAVAVIIELEPPTGGRH